jgi:hypothetical protein
VAETPGLLFLELPRERIVDLIWVLEGCEGLAVPRVLHKMRGLAELLFAPDRADELAGLLLDLNQNHFPVKIIPRPDAVASILDDPPGDAIEAAHA